MQQDGAQKSLGFLSGEAEEKGREENGQARKLEVGQVPQGEQQGRKPESRPQQLCFAWPGLMEARL